MARYPIIEFMANTVDQHRSFVCCCDVFGSAIATGSHDNTVKLWDPRTGRHYGTVVGHTGAVWCCASSHDKRLLATGSSDQTAKVWDFATRACLCTLQGHAGTVFGCAFSPNDALLVTGSDDTTVKLWTVDDGASIFSLQAHSAVWSCAISLDGTVIAGALSDAVLFWDTCTGSRLRTLQGHTKEITKCCFSVCDDVALLATASRDTTAKIWNVRTGKCVQTLVGHTAGVLDCGFSPDGLMLVTGALDATAKIWTTRGGWCIYTLCHHGWVTSCRFFSLDASLLLFTISIYGDMCIWRVPHELQPRIKILLMILFYNRRQGQQRLPGELWKWMDDEGFFYD